jgi:hypothetical protein
MDGYPGIASVGVDRLLWAGPGEAAGERPARLHDGVAVIVTGLRQEPRSGRSGEDVPRDIRERPHCLP